METKKVSDRRIKAGNILVGAACIILSFALWNEHEWYELLVPYATAFSFLVLTAVALCCVPVSYALKDPEFYLVAGGCLVAAINIFAVHSGKGAWLTASGLLLAIYLSDKIRFSMPYILFMCIVTGFYFYYWTFDVKGYFKGYNTNYGGLVLITGFVFAVTALIAFSRKLAKTEKKGALFLRLFTIFMFAWGLNIIAWYRARCALVGLIVYAFLLLVPDKIWKNRVFYTMLTLFATVGAIGVSLLYVAAGRYMTELDIRIFYKDIISGRNLIWQDLWGAFLQKPITGIGSSYKINVDWMEGMFEVHNGLLDILIVHGVIVFAITLYLLIRRLMALREKASSNIMAKSAASAVFAILCASFMENFFIVPPFLLYVLVLIAIALSV